MAPRGLQDAPRANDRKSLDIDSCRRRRRRFRRRRRRTLQWPQEACKTLQERTIAKVLILTHVVAGFVVALFFVVAAPFVLPCSSREDNRQLTIINALRRKGGYLEMSWWRYAKREEFSTRRLPRASWRTLGIPQGSVLKSSRNLDWYFRCWGKRKEPLGE